MRVPEHREALDRLGPSVHHRRFFAPVVAARRKAYPETIETRSVRGDTVIDDRGPSRSRPGSIELRSCYLAASRALSHMRDRKGRSYRLAYGSAWAFRTFHAFHLPDYRTDPRPAAAGGLARGAVSGGAVAVPAAAAVSQPARRSRHRAGLGREYQVGTDSGPAAGVLARRYRVPRRRQSHVRRLSAGAALHGRDVLDLSICWPAPLSAASRRCSRCC